MQVGTKKRQAKGRHCDCSSMAGGIDWRRVLLVEVLDSWDISLFSSPYGSPPTVFALAAKLGPLTAA